MQVEMHHDVAQGVLETRRVLRERSDQSQAFEPVSLAEQQPEMWAVCGVRAGVEQSTNVGEG